ncbi:hypothetical protein JY651_38385 [Pyxidicoccus parkwayensis]|uniref:Outer membrane protein beta-barrel domain-containing protein n=1 Tax=Pyxidicoccus parkwayensis TaxID=2813578 RepID=A0ABX7NY67_9BACT|nr:hypothetical protein [Pyxidicoccus parkwaysis]QSQ21023.1 hypothetical protein JY651_38385 [Pyxidicoccus parkwaysis]
MNHIHTLLMTALLSTSVTAMADDLPSTEASQARRTILGISFVPLLGNGVLEVGGERVVNPRVSVGLGLQVGLGHDRYKTEDTGSLPNAERESKRSSYRFGAEPMARFFLMGMAPEGLWLSPRLNVAREWVKTHYVGSAGETNLNTGGWSVGGAALLGYSTIVGRGLAIQFGAGFDAQYRRDTQAMLTLVSSTGDELTMSESSSHSWSVGERVELAVGWAF